VEVFENWRTEPIYRWNRLPSPTTTNRLRSLYSSYVQDNVG
jgi:hypothetical protein